MSFNLRDIQYQKSITLQACISNAGVVNTNPVFNLNNLNFQPDYIVVNQINCTFDLITDSVNQLFTINSNISQDVLGTFSGQTTSPSSPLTIVKCQAPFQTIQLQITALDTSGNQTTPVMAHDWFLSIQLNLIKLVDYSKQSQKSLPI